MRKFLRMLEKDENSLSIGRMCALLAFILFAGISIYLALLGRTWGNYEAFSVACVVYMLAQLGNKFVEMRGIKIGVGKDGC